MARSSYVMNMVPTKFETDQINLFADELAKYMAEYDEQSPNRQKEPFWKLSPKSYDDNSGIPSVDRNIAFEGVIKYIENLHETVDKSTFHKKLELLADPVISIGKYYTEKNDRPNAELKRLEEKVNALRELQKMLEEISAR